MISQTLLLPVCFGFDFFVVEVSILKLDISGNPVVEILSTEELRKEIANQISQMSLVS